MPTYKNTSTGELKVVTTCNPPSAPRVVAVPPGGHFVAHSSEVDPEWLAETGASGEPRAVKVSDFPADDSF